MKRVLVSGILTLALCLSVITGATYALFTSDNSTNISATSGKVELHSAATIENLYSPKAIGLDGVITDAEDVADTAFASGGTVEIDGSNIAINNMTPGDKAILKIEMTNASSVAFIQRLVLSCIDEDQSFFGQLLIGLSDDGVNYTYYADYASAWESSETIYAAGNTVHKYLSIELPGHVGNKYQGKSAHMALNVMAVQSNTAASGIAAAATVHMVRDQAGFDAALAVATDADIIYIASPVTGELRVAFEEEKTVTIRGYDINKLVVDAPAGTVHVYNNVSDLDADAVAMHSLHVYGDVASLRMEQGRVVVGHTSVVEEIVIAAADSVTLSVPAKKINDEVLVGKVGNIVLENTSSEATTKFIFPEGMDIPCDSMEEVVLHRGTEFSYEKNADENKLYIGDAEGMRQFGKEVNAGNRYADWTVYLIGDVDLENREWTAIGSISNPFSGSFDGQGHTISNLKITKEIGNIATSNRQGLFGTIVPSGETFFGNVTLHNANITAGYHVGGLVATCDSSSQTKTNNYFVMSNVRLTGKVTIEGWQGVAGVMGSGNMAELSDIVVDVEEGSYVSNVAGGPDSAFNIVGSVKGGGYLSEIRNITSNMDVMGKCVSIGGLFGVIGGQSTSCEISNVSYSGTVTVYTSTETQWGYGRYCYNGLIIGTPRFNITADAETCTSTGTLALHVEDGVILNSNEMSEVYTWGTDLFGASRDNAYNNKSYAKAYVTPAAEGADAPAVIEGNALLDEEAIEN